MYQPPEPSGVGRCLHCASCIDESEQVGGICYECQPAEEGKQPAFPVQANEYAGHGPSHGITIRDYFAAKALDGFMQWALAQQPLKDYETAAKIAAGYAESSYMIADAMLSARVKT